jgi:GxxExxY protein
MARRRARPDSKYIRGRELERSDWPRNGCGGAAPPVQLDKRSATFDRGGHVSSATDTFDHGGHGRSRADTENRLKTRGDGALLEGRTTGTLIRLFYRTYDRLGFGFLESVYANALALEFTAAGLAFAREAVVDVWYRETCCGRFRADFLVDSRVVVELKASRMLTDPDRAQLINYLRCSRLEVELLLHFGPKASFERMIYTNDRKGDLPRSNG